MFILQWNLDLNRDSFLFQTQENPGKSTTLKNEHLNQYKCLNASDYICRCYHTLIRKIEKNGNIFFENLKI